MAYSIWRRNRDWSGNAAALEADIPWQGEGALVLRPEATVAHVALDAAGCAFLDACAAGCDLASAGVKALEREPGADLARLMQVLLEAGAFAQRGNT